MSSSANDETLALMESLGYSREAGLRALNRFPDDPDRAIGWLMDQPNSAHHDVFDEVGPAPPTPSFRLSPSLPPSHPGEGDQVDDFWTGPTVRPDLRDGRDPIDLSRVNDGLAGLSEDDQLKMALEASLRDSGPPVESRSATTAGVYGGMSGWSSAFGGPSPAQSTHHLPQGSQTQWQARPSAGRQYSDSLTENENLNVNVEHKEFVTTDGVDIVPAEGARLEVEDPHSNNPFKHAIRRSNLGTFHKVEDARVDDGTMGVVLADQPSTGGLNVSFDDNLLAHPSPARPPPPPIHKDDTDLERALALSMMDVVGGGAASMDPLDGMNDLEMRDAEVNGVETGAGLIPEGAENRPEGAPMLYRTTDYAAGFIVCMFQCLLATPQMRLFLERLQWPRTESRSKAQSALTFMQGLLRASSYHKSAYIEVDTSQLVDMDLCNYTMASPLSERLRATVEVLSSYCECVAEEVVHTAQSSEADLLVDVSVPTQPSADDLQYQRYLKRTASLLKSFGGSIHGSTDPWQATMCPLEHDAARDHHIMQCISRAVWAQEPNQLLFSIADIFAIGVRKAPRSFGEGVVGVMQLEEELYMDRFLMSNAAKSIETRGQENWRKMEMKRCEETLAELSTFKNCAIEQSLDAVISHYESGEAVKGEEEDKRERVSGEMVELLKRMKTSISAKKEALQARIQILKKEVSEIWDVPDLKKHRYLLRAISYYVGFDSPTAYHSYVRQDDGKWWKLAQKQATETDFATIVKDATGLHYDQGPFFIIYSRDGPTPTQDVNLATTSESGSSHELDIFERDMAMPTNPSSHRHSPKSTITQLPVSSSSASDHTADVHDIDTSTFPKAENNIPTPSDSEMTFDDDISTPPQIKEFDVTNLDPAFTTAR